MPLRTTLFAINFSFAVLMLAMSVYSIGAAISPFSFLGGIMIFPFAAAFAVAEWVAWYRAQRELEVGLAITALLLADLVLFGVIVNVGEALRHSWPQGFGWFVLTGCAITAYFVLCGI